MTNLLNTGLDWLEARMLGYCSEYRRGDDTRIVAAVFGKTDIEIEESSGISVSSFVWDFLIEAQVLGFELYSSMATSA